MARRGGLTDAEISEYLEQRCISPTQSEGDASESDDSASDTEYNPIVNGETSSDASAKDSDNSIDDVETGGGSRAPEMTESSTSVATTQHSKRRRVTRSREGAGSIATGPQGDNGAISESPPAQTSSRRPTRKPVKNRADIGSVETSADKTKWTRVDLGNISGRRNCQNVLKETSGPTGMAIREIIPGSPVSAFRLFVNEPMMRLIKNYTELEARRVLNDDSWALSLEELDAFFAILYVRGVMQFSSLPFAIMWHHQWGIQFVKDTMPRDRATEILKYLRFDDRTSRQHRRGSDPFCLVSEIWNKFRENCVSYFKPTENITVDEQLYPTKCRCPFLQYMANKPDKFGIKFWMLADSKERYVLDAIPYLGKDESRPVGCSLGEHVVMRLTEPYLKKGRNVTCDNFFTSLKLGVELKKKQTSLVGTLNRARKEVPPSVKKAKDPLYSAVVYKANDTCITSYQGKVNKNVLILSTLHTGVTVSEGPKKKPETVEYYNQTKCGVDTVDQMARKYSVRAGTRRWPVHVFYNILDLAMINAHTLYKLVTKTQISRHRFIREVAVELSRSRVAIPVQPVQLQPNGHRVRCQVRRCNGNKTKDKCSECNKAVCGSCKSDKIICKLCEIDE